MLPNDGLQIKDHCINNYKLSCSVCNNKSNNAINFCVTHNHKVCVNCSSTHNNHNNNNDHEIISIKKYMDKTFNVFYGNYSSVLNNKSILDAQMDEATKFLKINPKTLKIERGNRFLHNNELPNDPLLVVSFVGYSGSGKSSTIGNLCSDEYHPIPGAVGSADSTSSDINAFLGKTNSKFGNPSESLKYLILDSEGLGGTSAPTTYMCDSQIKDEIYKARFDYVQIAYSRLLYLISDVFVFTFRGSLSEKSNIVKAIISFIAMASSISNNSSPPHLIILLNHSTAENTSSLDDTQFAKENFFKGFGNGDETLKQLDLFFKSVSVIYVPNLCETQENTYQRYFNQIDKLKDQISSNLCQSLSAKRSNKINTSKSSIMSTISNLVRVLNNSTDGSCDIDCSEFTRKRFSSHYFNHLNQNIKKPTDFDLIRNRPINNNQQNVNNNSINNDNLQQNANNNIKSPTIKPSQTIQNKQPSSPTNRAHPPIPNDNGSPKLNENKLTAPLTKRVPPPVPSLATNKPSPITDKPSTAINKLSPTINHQTTPVINKPSPIINKPSPIINKPSPIVNNPSPIVNKPSPIVNKPLPVINKPSPIVSKPLPVINKPSPSKLIDNNIPIPTKKPPQPNDINNSNNNKELDNNNSNQEPIEPIRKLPQPNNNTSNTSNNNKLLNTITSTLDISTLSNDNIADNLITFFNLNFNQFINSKLKRNDSYEKSIQLLKSKLLSIYAIYLKRNRVLVSGKDEVCSNFISILDKVSEELFKIMPCGARCDKLECINYQDSHPFHQTKEKSQRKEVSFYVFSKKCIEVPNVWSGQWINVLKKEDVNLSSHLKNQYKLFSSGKEIPPCKVVDNSITFCGDICVNCIIAPSTIRMSCGHILCSDCIGSTFKCPINGCASEIYYKKEIDFNSNIGARILCLDGGGGIRGIVECCALKIIQDSLYGIEITSLFDLIVGKSTGGLISILSTKKSPSDIIDSLKSMADSIFNPQSKTLPKYSRKQINQYLNGIKLKSQLKSSYEKTRIALVAATLDECEPSECIFANYYRKSNHNEEYKFITECIESDAIEATLSTPGFFPSFKFNGHDYYDGCIIDNNPCMEAINEFKTLWGNSSKKVDLLLSLGNGLFTSLKSNPLTFSNGESCWLKCRAMHRDLLNDSNSFRVNQRFKEEIPYDAKDQQSINSLTSSYSENNGETILKKSINKILASLFYVSNLESSNSSNNNCKSSIKGTIQFRLERTPIEICLQLARVEPKFSLRNSNSDTTFIIISQDYASDRSCKIRFEILNPTNSIDIVCHLVSANGIPNDNSISGCPFTIN